MSQVKASAKFDEGKFKELILYVCSKTLEDPKCGATKLNKLLFYSDFLAYAKFGKPITGATYQHGAFGPVPREFLPIRKTLIEKGDAVLVPREYLTQAQKVLVALRPPDLSAFGPEEISMVDWVIEQCWDHNAKSISDKSHELPGWKIAPEGENIPYCAVFLSPDPLTQHEITRGKQIAKKLGREAA